MYVWSGQFGLWQKKNRNIIKFIGGANSKGGVVLEVRRFGLYRS